MPATKKFLEILNYYSNFPIDADFFSGNSPEYIQKKLAPILRHAAIDNLRNGQGMVAKAFRGEYIASGLGNFEEFLVAQGENAAWGTYIEAASIGELLGAHVIAMPVKGKAQQSPIALYSPSGDTAPVLQLFNKDNIHWYAAGDQTLGDGNCLYNALAENLQRIVIQELPPPVVEAKKEVPSVSASKQSFFSKEDNDVVTSQAAILRAIRLAPKPSEIEQQLNEEKKRFDSYPSEVQVQIKEQIAADYKLALKLAREEMRAFHQSMFVCYSSEYHPSPAAACA